MRGKFNIIKSFILPILCGGSRVWSKGQDLSGHPFFSRKKKPSQPQKKGQVNQEKNEKVAKDILWPSAFSGSNPLPRTNNFRMKGMRQYTPEKYIRTVENIDDSIVQNYMQVEMDLIRNIKGSKDKTFIDLGAGYGRVLHLLAQIARNVIAIEINPAMLSELRKRARKHRNVKVIKGDMLKLYKLLEKEDVKNPVLLILQNTLGTIEGDYRKVLNQMKLVAKRYNGEVVISMLKSESLRSWGLKMYSKLKAMVGEVDLEKTDPINGFFVSKTGYASRWWSSDDIKQIKDFFGGNVTKEILTPNFCILEIKI